MQQLTLCAFVLVLLISGNGFSFVHVCGNYTGTDGVTSVKCFNFSGKCDDEKNLAGLGELFPGGWTCAMSGIAVQDTGSVHLIAAKDGSASVVVGGVRTPVGSDDFLKFVNRMLRENQGLRVNTQALQGQFDTFLDTDNGVVANARLQELSRELGVPIEYEGSSRPGVQPGTGRGAAAPGAASPSVQPKTSQAARTGPEDPEARRPDHCSLPDCSCRIVNTSGVSLCEGGTEEETAAGVHYCKCGKFGPSTIQSDGGGGSFTVSDAGAIGQYDREDGGVKPVAKPTTPKPKPTSTGPAIEGNLQAQRQYGVTPTPSAAQSSGGQSTQPTRGPVASENSVGPPADVQKTEGREAAILLCRDVEMYGRSRQVATSPGARPPFSSVEPLCSIPDTPQRIQIYHCGGATGAIVGKCADSWWESFWYGLSYCQELKTFCDNLGAQWSTQ